MPIFFKLRFPTGREYLYQHNYKYSLRGKDRRLSGSDVGHGAVVCVGIVPGEADVPYVPQGEGRGVDPRGRPVCTSLPLGAEDTGIGQVESSAEAAHTVCAGRADHGVS
ncbi:hypothetical protein ElyMa_005000200 [Elysia marginata]|uniref:Uncharacterized protein n=1 Tax=Elysia marginata TaxID=1093978 RepID=A0AAV4J8K8_9GAST|nr:hypothetical protein ElyMa_005000200 [Elysia marginata]